MTNQLKGFFSAYELAKTIQIASPEIYIVWLYRIKSQQIAQGCIDPHYLLPKPKIPEKFHDQLHGFTKMGVRESNTWMSVYIWKYSK